MAEDTTQVEVDVEASASEPPADLDHWKRMSRQNERAAKAALKESTELKARLARLEDLSKSEDQKLADRTAELDREAAALRSEVSRLRIAARYGIGEDDLDLLGSGDEDEIEARAKRVSELSAAAAAASAAPAAPTAPPAGRRPVEALRPGATPADLPLNGDPIVDALKGHLGIT